MKYIKTYEEESLYNQMILKLKIDDYIIGQDLHLRKDLKEFLENSVGQLYYIERFDKNVLYYAKYNFVPDELRKYFQIEKNLILYIFTWGEFWTATPEQIKQQKIKDDANKYNL
jgi:hypothetical protein